MNQRFRYINPKIHDHANGQACQNCGAQDGTVVFAHSNMAEHGHGRGIKAHSLFGAFMCHRCHAWLDQGKGKDPTGIWNEDRQDKQEMFLKSMFKTQIILLRDGILK